MCSSTIGFSCRVCRQRFYRKDMLQRHLKIHQLVVLLGDSAAGATVDLPPPPPSPPLKKQGETPMCEICAKRLLNQNALKRHRQTVHRQSGGFLCRVCDRRFTEKTTSRDITSENMAIKSTRHRLATLVPFVRRASTAAVI